MKIKSLIAVAVAIMLMAFKAQAQTPVTSEKDIPLSVGLPFDSQAATNLAALASLCILNTDYVVAEVYYGANGEIDSNYGNPVERVVVSFVGKVRSFNAMCDAINQQLAAFKVVDPTQYVEVQVKFCKGDVSQRYGNYGSNPSFQVLLYASAGGKLQEGKVGQYYFSPTMNVRLNNQIRFNIPGLAAGKSISKYGDYHTSEPLRNINSNGDFDMSVNAIETGGYLVAQGHFDDHFETVAISLVSGDQVPLENAFISFLLEGSQNIVNVKNATSIGHVIESYNGRLVNPLFVTQVPNLCPPGYTCSPVNFRVNVVTTEGIRPRGYRVVNVYEGKEVVYSGSPVVMQLNPNIEYHIIPDLPVIQTNGSSSGNGGGVGVIVGDQP